MDPPVPPVEQQASNYRWMHMIPRESRRKLMSDQQQSYNQRPSQGGARIRSRRPVKISRFSAADSAASANDDGSPNGSGAQRKPRRKTRLNFMRRLRLRRVAGWLFRPRNIDIAKLLAKVRDGYVRLMMAAASSQGVEGVATLAPMSYRLPQPESDRPFGTRSVKEYDPSILLAMHRTNSQQSSFSDH